MNANNRAYSHRLMRCLDALNTLSDADPQLVATHISVDEATPRIDVSSIPPQVYHAADVARVPCAIGAAAVLPCRVLIVAPVAPVGVH